MFKRTLVTFVALCSLSAVAPAALAAGETHVMLTTSAGNIELALDSQKAPVSTQNFVDYVNSGYYNNTIFHRVIPGFMIQGGGFTADMQQKSTKADQERSRQRPAQPARHHLDGAHRRQGQRHQPVLPERGG